MRWLAAQTVGRAAAIALAALSLAACATDEPAQTTFDWPVGATYTVRPGDTLSGIAASYRVRQDQLADYNRLYQPNLIYPGQVLRIPRPGIAMAAPAPQPRPVQMAQDDHWPDWRMPFTPTPQPRPDQRVPDRAVRHIEPDPAAGSLHFLWPVDGRVIARFGQTANGGRNDGINIETRMGAPIHAAAAGTVIYAGDELKNYGNLVLIRHDDGYVTAYAHAEKLAVERDMQVRAGQIIGYAGESGNVSAPQLHFEIRRGVRPVDPAPLLVASSAS